MTRRIFRAILAAAMAALLASALLITGCLYNDFNAMQARQLQDELSLAAAGVEALGQTYLDALPENRYRLTWIAGDGTVLYDGQADPRTMENHGGREEVRQALASGRGESQRYSDTLFEKTIYYARRLEDGTVLRVALSRATVVTVALEMLRPMLLIVLAALALTFFLARRLSAGIVEPLNRLDLDHPLENDAYDELAPLLTRLDRQRRQIDQQLQILRRRQDEFDQITAGMNEGLVLLDEGGSILSMNPAAMALLHADRSALGQPFLTVERGPEVTDALQRAMDAGHSEIQLDRAGRTYQLDVSRIQSGGSVVGAVLLTFDVTEQALAEQGRREFTANVSHELKTPLTSILGSAELLEAGMVRETDVPRFAGHIHTEARRLLTLIEDIIRLSQLDEGQLPPVESVDLAAVARETVETLTPAAERQRVTLTLETQPCALRSVPRLIHEILYNLTENAVKYNVPGGTVRISVFDTAEGVRLTVADTGIGIPPEHQARVFERFYRVDKSHSKLSGGTGLGLSIVKHAAARCGAAITLQSVPGTGTTITVVFPTGEIT